MSTSATHTASGWKRRPRPGRSCGQMSRRLGQRVLCKAFRPKTSSQRQAWRRPRRVSVSRHWTYSAASTSRSWCVFSAPQKEGQSSRKYMAALLLLRSFRIRAGCRCLLTTWAAPSPRYITLPGTVSNTRAKTDGQCARDESASELSVHPPRAWQACVWQTSSCRSLTSLLACRLRSPSSVQRRPAQLPPLAKLCANIWPPGMRVALMYELD